MASLKRMTDSELQALLREVKDRITGCGSLEEVAQKSARGIYDALRSSMVLVRFYAALPLQKLPTAERAFATELAVAKGFAPRLKEDTLVLTLMGTNGDKAEWSQRRSSRGHLAIPLVSADFIGGIPMVSRMLSDLGVSIEQLDPNNPGIETRTFGTLGGLFYVADAASAVDQKGRKIITAQDFVAAHGVKTVIGTAGRYILRRTFITLILFTREAIDLQRAQGIMPLANVITSVTSDLVRLGRLFAA